MTRLAQLTLGRVIFLTLKMSHFTTPPAWSLAFLKGLKKDPHPLPPPHMSLRAPKAGNRGGGTKKRVILAHMWAKITLRPSCFRVIRAQSLKSQTPGKPEAWRWLAPQTVYLSWPAYNSLWSWRDRPGFYANLIIVGVGRIDIGHHHEIPGGFIDIHENSAPIRNQLAAQFPFFIVFVTQGPSCHVIIRVNRIGSSICAGIVIIKMDFDHR